MSNDQTRPTPHVAYFRGEDAYAIERAVTAMAVELGRPGPPLETWRVSENEGASASATTSAGAAPAEDSPPPAGRRYGRLLDEIERRLGTAPLFGGGTLVVIRQPASLVRDKASKARLGDLIATVPPGNALVFSELTTGSARDSKSTDALREAVAAAGGSVREFPPPTRERMERFIEARGSELELRFAPGAARLLAERVGAYVREGDVDRRRQSELANAELEKLALFRPGATVTREDVAALVAEAVPGSAWAFLDSVAARRTREAAQLADRLLADGVAFPVVVSQLHRRLRELITVREHLSSGVRAPQLVRVLRVQPFRAQKLAEQAAAWTTAELEDALAGLLEVDLISKGITLDGTSVGMSDERSALALDAWVAERVAREAQSVRA